MMTVMSLPPGGKRQGGAGPRARRGRPDPGRRAGAEVVDATRSAGSVHRLAPAGIRSRLVDRSAGPGTDHVGDALARLHRDHYSSLVRLATLVVGDRGVAEQVTQDAFVKLQLRWGGLRRLDRAPAYLRSAVLNAARSHLRRRKVSDRYDARRTAPVAAATPESAALGQAEQQRVMAALRRLPERQREAVVLRFYVDLPEADIAAAMGVSAGSVKTHLHRGLASLAQHLGEEGT
jgi:RNA polymerase sigma-70 factor (sigma-E family)